eukprot:3807428-Lingulodinium_polyedra.AAC.1
MSTRAPRRFNAAQFERAARAQTCAARARRTHARELCNAETPQRARGHTAARVWISTAQRHAQTHAAALQRCTAHARDRARATL